VLQVALWREALADVVRDKHQGLMAFRQLLLEVVATPGAAAAAADGLDVLFCTQGLGQLMLQYAAVQSTETAGAVATTALPAAENISRAAAVPEVEDGVAVPEEEETEGGVVSGAEQNAAGEALVGGSGAGLGCDGEVRDEELPAGGDQGGTHINRKVRNRGGALHIIMAPQIFSPLLSIYTHCCW
jgi:hypothetical protein